jgi:hypothetical protein
LKPENMPLDIVATWLEVWASEGYEGYWKQEPEKQETKSRRTNFSCHRLNLTND